MKHNLINVYGLHESQTQLKVLNAFGPLNTQINLSYI
jgi:hypothetical protein